MSKSILDQLDEAEKTVSPGDWHANKTIVGVICGECRANEWSVHADAHFLMLTCLTCGQFSCNINLPLSYLENLRKLWKP